MKVKKKCPFCNTEVSSLPDLEDHYSDRSSISCEGCGATGPIGKDPNQARELWDIRNGDL